MNFECVVWRDSVSCGGWHCPDTLTDFRGRNITTVGFVVGEDDQDLLLAMSVGDASNGPVYCNLISIPKVVIVERSAIARPNVESCGGGEMKCGPVQ